MEVWRTIPGTDEWYSASSDGRIRSNARVEQRSNRQYRHREKILAQSDHSGGYLYVGGGILVPTRFVHRLVAMAFMPDADFGLEANHKDGNKKNNRISNLEWTTRSENQTHSFQVLGQQQVNKIAVTISRGEDVATFDSITAAATFCGVRVSQLAKARSRGQRCHGWEVRDAA